MRALLVVAGVLAVGTVAVVTVHGILSAYRWREVERARRAGL